MKIHELNVWPSAASHAREDELAWQLAELAVDPVPVEEAVIEMLGNRIIDNASVAIASLERGPVANARQQALAHPRSGGATLYGLPADCRVSAEWASWANGTAVRELDYHDTYLAEEYSHPGDNILPLLAVAQQTGRSGADLARGLATAYEIHIDLVKAISLHKHKIDHVAHLGPAAAAGIGTMLDLPVEIIYQAINHVLHVTTSTRQSRKGQISSWKAYAPGHATKLAVEAVDRAMHSLTGAGRGKARDTGEFHQGTFGGIPGAGLNRSRPSHAPRHRGNFGGRTRHHSHQPPHACGDRQRCQRSAEI